MSTQVHSPSQITGFVTRAGYFLWHFLEMCLVMCIGGITINVLFFGLAARLGFPNLFEKFPQFSLLLVGVNLSIPMIAWMRFRGHEWRPTLEMASTSIILPVLLIGATWLSLIPESSQLPLLKKLVCPVMLIPMLFRLDLYTAHHAQHHAHSVDKHHEHAS
jgi:hypothetical protein